MSQVFHGGCHCGALRVELRTALDPHVLPLRACQCSFCRKHAGVTTSDPAGLLVIEVARPEQLQRYRFALGITDFLLCRSCGVYVAAIMEADGKLLGVLNVNVLDDRQPFARPPVRMEYGSETVQDREGRRGKVWMPVEMKES